LKESTTVQNMTFKLIVACPNDLGDTAFSHKFNA
jgi:hypothetical protein